MSQQLISELPTFLLILVRVSSFFVTAPIFSYRTIPSSLKIGLSVFLALIEMISLNINTIPLNGDFVLLVLKEAIVGLSIGFIAGIIFYSIQVAGAFIDTQMGFAIANVIDPQSGISSPITGQVLYVFALLFLLTVNGHYLLLDGLYYSYKIIPINELNLHLGQGELTLNVVRLFTQMFMIALQMALPVVGSLFLVDVGLGIIARTVPQVNVFVVGMPLKIMVGILIIGLLIPVYIAIVRQMVEGLEHIMKSFMQLLGGA